MRACVCDDLLADDWQPQAKMMKPLSSHQHHTPFLWVGFDLLWHDNR